jgi:hypothetical protein
LIDLVFLAKAKDGDYHQEMNRLIFLNWLENQLRPDLKICLFAESNPPHDYQRAKLSTFYLFLKGSLAHQIIRP